MSDHLMSYRDKPLKTVIDPNWPCNDCGHRFGDHTFMYGIGTHDRYRCNARGCVCGEAYKVTAAMVRPDQIDTPEKREEIIKRMSGAREEQKRKFKQ